MVIYIRLGFLASYASVSLCFNKEIAAQVIEQIIRLLNKYECYKIPPYDVDISTIIMVLDLMDKTNQNDSLKYLMENIVYDCIIGYRKLNIYPAPTDSFEEALRISRREKGLEYQTSSFWGYLLLLIYKYNNEELYEKVKEFLNEDLQKTTTCVWFLRKDEELALYEKAAMNKSGEGIVINTFGDYKEFCGMLEFIFEQYKYEELSFDIFGFSALECIICRYYSYIPRVTIKQESDELNC